VHFAAVFNRQKYGSLGTRVYSSITKLQSLQKQRKIIQKFTIRPKMGIGGGSTIAPPPEYATAVN